jgi:hypothetical protein
LSNVPAALSVHPLSSSVKVRERTESPSVESSQWATVSASTEPGRVAVVNAGEGLALGGQTPIRGLGNHESEST